MARVRVVERAVHVVIHVVAVGDGGVPRRRVRDTALDGRAGAGPPPVHIEVVLVGVLLVGRVQVPVVQVVGVIAVLHGLVAATLAVPVGVLFVFVAGHGPIVSLREGAVNRGIIA
jgi:hypothetical protein